MISLQVETLHGMVTNVNFGNYANVVWTTMQVGTVNKKVL